MTALAGIDVLPDGTWDCGSTGGSWTPGGCGCGGSCGCGGKCGGEGGCGKGSCGGSAAPQIPDYNGEIWAKHPRQGYVTYSPPGTSAGSVGAVSSDGTQGSATGTLAGDTGYSPGVTVEPGRDNGGNPDPCLSIITLHVWLDVAAAYANQCPPFSLDDSFLGRPPVTTNIRLDSEISEARRILEGKRFACPCKQPPARSAGWSSASGSTRANRAMILGAPSLSRWSSTAAAPRRTWNLVPAFSWRTILQGLRHIRQVPFVSRSAGRRFRPRRIQWRTRSCTRSGWGWVRICTTPRPAILCPGGHTH